MNTIRKRSNFQYREATISLDVVTHPHWKLLSKFHEDCGEIVENRIVGGINATLGQYPWLARLDYFDYYFYKNMFGCGGAIVSDRYILSAAHCLLQPGLKLTQVRLGEYYTKTNPDCFYKECAPPVQDIKVESYKCHEDYKKVNFHNDICLIRLAKPIQFNNYVQPICLPVYDTFLTNEFENENMEVAGWGIYDIDTDLYADVLQTLKVPVTSQARCKAVYDSQLEISDNQFCAGGVIGQDACSGDSGGPLMSPFSFGTAPRYFMVGVVSFGPTKCGKSDKFGGYTKVAPYVKWILDNVEP